MTQTVAVNAFGLDGMSCWGEVLVDAVHRFVTQPQASDYVNWAISRALSGWTRRKNCLLSRAQVRARLKGDLGHQRRDGRSACP